MRDLDRVAKALEKAGLEVDEALKIELQQASEQLREDAIKNIQDSVNLQRDYIGKAIKVRKLATDGRDLVGGIQGTKSSTSLASYPFKQLFGPNKYGTTIRQGVSGSVRKGRQYTARHFFILPFPNRRFGIALRTGRARSDFKVLQSLSVNQLLTLNAEQILERIDAMLIEAGARIAVEAVNV